MKFFRPQKLLLVILVLSCLYLLVALVVLFHNQALAQAYPEKAWIHRVNSKVKLKEIRGDFDGIELDLVFLPRQNTFDVNHPPTKSKNLSLFAYLSSTTLNPDEQFWFDFKNLDETTQEKSVARLDSLCKAFGLKNENMIVESTKPEFLKPFQEKGFKTSYYLPQGLSDLKGKELENAIDSIGKMISLCQTDFISSGKRDYFKLKKYFPDVQLLTWSFYDSSIENVTPLSIISELKKAYQKYLIISDENVEIVLFEYFIE